MICMSITRAGMAFLKIFSTVLEGDSHFFNIEISLLIRLISNSGSNCARNTRPITPRLVLHSVQLLLLVFQMKEEATIRDMESKELTERNQQLKRETGELR